MKMQTVAAAIAAVADREITAAGVPNSDADKIANIMGDAERMVAEELARRGMAMAEAAALASEAAMRHAPDSAESNDLADQSYRNRGNPLPTAANDAAPATPANSDDGMDNSESTAALAGAPVASAAPLAPVEVAAPVAPAIISRAPEAVVLPRYTVSKKKVHEVIRGIDQGDELFDFEVPFLNWEEAHARIPDYDASYNMDPADLLTILYAITECKSTNLVGPHGCGKTQFVEQMAVRLNFPVATLPMDGQLTRSQLIGQEKIRATATGNESYFSSGLLPRALAEPGFILFDEIDRGVSDLQYACHSVYLQSGLTILEDGGRHVPFHELNRVFATANTKGRGSLDGMYLAAEEMSEATRDRLTLWIEMSYQSADDDALVLRNKVQGIDVDTSRLIADIAAQIREAYLHGKCAQTCSMRQQLEVARFAAFLTRGVNDADRRAKLISIAFSRVIMGRASEEDKGLIQTFIETKLPDAFSNPII